MVKMPKSKPGKRPLVSQDDFYVEATKYEEQAERWLLSDIKKALRFYVQALDMYEKALNAPEATPHRTYNIKYNETRLLLQVYTDYVASNGYINLLQYVRLDDIPEVSKLALPSTEIVSRFEQVYAQFPNERTWDLDTNLLTCYLTLMESSDTHKLSGEDIVELTTKFIDLSQRSLEFQLAELRTWEDFTPEEADDSSFEAGSGSGGAESTPGDGSGVVSHPDQLEGSESMEVADQVTAQVLGETIACGFSFLQGVMELVVEGRLGGADQGTLNLVQLNFLDDMVKKFGAQLMDIYATACETLTLERKEIDIAIEADRGIQLIANGNLDSLQSYVNDTLGAPETSIEVLLAKIDVLNFAVSCAESSSNTQMQWQICSLLSKLLSEAAKRLAKAIQDSRASKFSSAGSETSQLVFQHCDVLVASSDNELRRWTIKDREAQDGGNKSRTMEILMKNAKTFLVNASKIAQQHVGLEETIVERLRRNYIYGKAKTRLSLIERSPQEPLIADISDLVAEHPFYQQVSSTHFSP